MSDDTYQNRQNLEIFCWPKLMETFKTLVEREMVAKNNLSPQIRSEIFAMASIAGGCQHCQAHGAYTLHMMGVDEDGIRDIWTFEQSAEFSAAEQAALRLSRDGALVPNDVTPQYFAELRKHYKPEGDRVEIGQARRRGARAAPEHPRSTEPDRVEY